MQVGKRSYSARLPQFLNLTTSKTQRFSEISSMPLTWQHQKRSKSARLPQFSKLTTSKTKQFCETSFKNGKLSAELTASYQCVLRFFHSICVKRCACHEKLIARSYQVLPRSRKIILANLRIWCSKIQPLSGNQRPDLLTSLMSMSLVLPLPREMHLPRSSSNVPPLPSFLELLQNPHALLTFDHVQNPLHLPHQTTSERPKVVRLSVCLSSRAPRGAWAAPTPYICTQHAD